MKKEIIAEILDRGKEDWIDFAEVMSIVRSRSGLAEPAAIALSVELIEEMLKQHLLKVGDLLKRGGAVLFAPWEVQSPEIVERIRQDVARLRHRPGIGDICWLSTTSVSEGRDVVHV